MLSGLSVHASPSRSPNQVLTPEPKAKRKKMSFPPETHGTVSKRRASARKPGPHTDDIKAKISLLLLFLRPRFQNAACAGFQAVHMATVRPAHSWCCGGPETGAVRMHLACPARVHRLSSAHTEPSLLLKCRF